MQEQTQNLESSRQQEVTAFTENFSFLRSLYLTSGCDDDEVCGRRGLAIDLEEDRNEIDEFYDEELKNQIELHELFEELAAVEESAVSEVAADGDLTSYQEQLSRLQVSEKAWKLSVLQSLKSWPHGIKVNASCYMTTYVDFHWVAKRSCKYAQVLSD